MPSVNDDTKHSEVTASLLLAINQAGMTATTDWATTTPSTAPNGPGASAGKWFSVLGNARKTLADLGYTIGAVTLSQATTLIAEPITKSHAALIKKVTSNRDWINL